MTAKAFPISSLVDVNPRLPDRLRSTDSKLVDFVPMSGLGDDGSIKPIGQRPISDVRKGFTYFENGDVLVAKITPCMENGKACAVTGLPTGIGFGSTEFHVLRPTPRIDGRYLFYMVWNPLFRNTAAGQMTGSAGQKRVPTAFFDRFAIPLPYPFDPAKSLAEQRRIAAILDKADSIRRKRAEQIETVNSLRQATLFASSLHASNKHIRIDEIAEVSGGLALSSRRDASSLRRPYLRVANVYRDRLHLTEIKEIGLEPNELEKTRLKRGDILIVEGHGNPEEVGRSAMWDGSVDDCVHQNHLIRVRCNLSKCLPEYLTSYINSAGGRRQMLRSGKTTSGLNTISLTNVRATTVALPPMKDQQRFVSAVERQNHLAKSLQCLESSATQLFGSLVQRAFRGEL